MNKITCEVCMDLMPLVRDGIASDDSKMAVEQHIKSCTVCEALYSEGIPPAVSSEKAFYRFRRQVQLFSVFLLMFGSFFGLGLTAGADMFYNSLIMPMIGMLGYVVFRWKALYNVPVLLFIIHALLNMFRILQGTEHLDIYSLLMWTALYSVFALLGIFIAAMFYYALKKNEKKGNTQRKLQKAGAFLAAALLVIGLCVFANALVGNPVSGLLAEKTAGEHLSEHYANTDFVIEKVSYSFKDGGYHAYIISPSSADSYFTLYFDMVGNLRYDSYESMVANGQNTARRLNQAYRELTDSVLESSAFPFQSEIAFGDLELTEGLELDRMYDIPKLGAEAGRLTVYVDEETVSVERASEILLEIRRLMEEGGAPFYSINFVLQYPRSEENGNRPEGRVEVQEFLCADIYQDKMTERVKKANEEACAYHKELDQKK